ncbi:Stk1 family PASTA domain-containing Ser/Thr kinase [Actinomadura harenae]|uniref:non-specific serine/threonine protein kinase n=1 Tax=Actinomadura harenae TaxID=2483351 RepID=A0A3M2M063_9ACTN|nr:Stk1 family PASTA domain-containing Ser/Thr kinase [Actinomadura harenae]RMI40518.1 Stk1 family PASTA domain-containing Ser/Thr kinase [Actinomadura harenae]
MDTTVADPLVGQVLDGRYRIESRIARGGMATVYLARDVRLDRVVAIKVMHAGLASDEEFVERFIGEAKAAAALSHPNVVAMYDQRTDGEHAFLVMEYVPGRTLRDLLTERGRIGPREALTLMQPVLAALGAAHRAGMVHRDVKPENVLITGDGQVKVADFGLARAESASKMTKTGMIIGTVGYLAPEQVVSGNADVRSDVYAAGILLYELLTGVLPHQADSPLAVAYKHVNEVVPPPSLAVQGLPPQVDALVTRATSHSPDARFTDANAFLAAVAEVVNGLPPGIDQRIEDAQPRPTSVLENPGDPGDPRSGHTAVYDPSAMPDGLGDGTPPRRTGADRALGALTGRYVLIALAAVAAVILGWAVWWQTSGQYDHVPDRIVGMKIAAAKSTLRGDGLNVRLGEAAYSDRAPKGTVAASDPGAGARVSKGQTITLTPSLGKTPRDVPDVNGSSLDDARSKLKDAGFTVGDVKQQTSQTVARDKVLRTDPVAGTKVSPDAGPVGIVVSTGMSMPNLVGQNADEATNTLRSMGLKVDTKKRKDKDKPANVVLEQQPDPGTGLSRGDKVTLVVNQQDCLVNLGGWHFGCDNPSGQGDQGDQLPVPDVTGRSVDDASSALEDAGFKVKVQGFGGDTVRVQWPTGGSKARRDSTVTLVKGP